MVPAKYLVTLHKPAMGLLKQSICTEKLSPNVVHACPFLV